MNKLKNLIRTTAVWLANLLLCRPAGWHASTKQANGMAACTANETLFEDTDLVSEDGQPIHVVPPLSPLGYLWHAIAEFSAGAFCVWIVYFGMKDVMLFMLSFLPIALLALAGVTIFTCYRNPDPAPSTRSPAAA